MKINSFRNLLGQSGAVMVASAFLMLTGCSETPTAAPPTPAEQQAPKDLGPPPGGQSEPDAEPETSEAPTKPEAGES